MAATDPFARHAFLSELEHQAQLALVAAERLPTSADRDLDSLEVWGALQSLLVAAGNVSKILWPSRRDSARRGVMLRDLLGIQHGNALADRTFRNHFEHYDERLEHWLSSRTSAGYTDRLIGSSVGFPHDFSPNVHRAYDIDTQTLHYLGESVPLRPIVLALEEIRLKCRATRHV